MIKTDQAVVDLAATLAWAIDIMEMYEQRLVTFGDPPELVCSRVHVAAKANARSLIQSVEQGKVWT